METDQDLQPLNEAEIRARLDKLPSWEYRDNKISKIYEFGSFSEGIGFINRLTPFCNKIDHHPDIHIYYKKIQFDLARFSTGGKITERDFTVARQIEKLYRG